MTECTPRSTFLKYRPSGIITAARENDLTGRVFEDIGDSEADCHLTALEAILGRHDDDVDVAFNRLINNRRAGESRLENFRRDSLAAILCPLTRITLCPYQRLLTVRDGLRHLGIERERLLNFDDVHKRHIGVLLLREHSCKVKGPEITIVALDWNENPAIWHSELLQDSY